MKIVKTGSTLRIFGDDLETFDLLPSATYKVCFDQGFYLEQMNDFKTLEEKIYGNHLPKIEKVLNSYQDFNRSMGIILSGDKGIGKSLFVQVLSQEVIGIGMPVIMVTKAFPGIADFLEKINQEVLVIFDEFEKVFNDHGGEPQNALLGLFDGTSQVKRMYAITVNHLHQVSEYIVSRTGRFHYHIRFEYPTGVEIETYLRDKLKEEYHGQIKHVIDFAHKVKLNYDSLRAIAFELNQGYSFGAAISDLNILTTDVQVYDINIVFEDDEIVSIRGQRLNMFADRAELSAEVGGEGDYFAMVFDPTTIESSTDSMIIPEPHKTVDLRFGTHNQTYTDEANIRIKSIEFSHHKPAGVNFRIPV